MEMVMCRSCGEFVQAIPDDGLKPSSEECPKCGGTEFEDTRSGDVIETR